MASSIFSGLNHLYWQAGFRRAFWLFRPSRPSLFEKARNKERYQQTFVSAYHLAAILLYPKRFQRDHIAHTPLDEQIEPYKWEAVASV